jgi:hypothetical protein
MSKLLDEVDSPSVDGYEFWELPEEGSLFRRGPSGHREVQNRESKAWARSLPLTMEETLRLVQALTSADIPPKRPDARR